MSLLYVLVVILLVLLLLGAIGSAPAWGHSAQWGWGPSGGLLGLVLLVIVVVLLLRVL